MALAWLSLSLFPSFSLSVSLSFGTQPLCCKEAQSTWRDSCRHEPAKVYQPESTATHMSRWTFSSYSPRHWVTLSPWVFKPCLWTSWSTGKPSPPALSEIFTHENNTWTFYPTKFGGNLLCIYSNCHKLQCMSAWWIIFVSLICPYHLQGYQCLSRYYAQTLKPIIAFYLNSILLLSHFVLGCLLGKQEHSQWRTGTTLAVLLKNKFLSAWCCLVEMICLLIVEEENWETWDDSEGRNVT